MKTRLKQASVQETNDRLSTQLSEGWGKKKGAEVVLTRGTRKKPTERVSIFRKGVPCTHRNEGELNTKKFGARRGRQVQKHEGGEGTEGAGTRLCRKVRNWNNRGAKTPWTTGTIVILRDW